ncbi:MAG: SPOR domain-containing protein [Rhodothermales bacterium]|nr:SPOR domain-containing protein [Rhodothermales bacterium]
MPPGLIEDAEFEVEEPDASGEPDALDEPHDEEPAAPAAPLEEPPEPVAEPVEDATEESVDAEPAPTAAATPDPLPAPTPPPVTVTAKQPPPPAPPPKERSRLPLALAAGAVLVVALIGIVWLLNRGEVAPPDVAAIPPAPATADTAAADRPEPVAGALPPAESDTAATDVPAPPSEPADPLRAAVAIAPADGGYTWVIASEASQAVAERRAEEFRARGFRTGVISAPLNGRTAHRVGIGQFETSDEALRYRDELPADVPEGTWLLRL